jgi:aspartyl-tRNA(Asn)/glutamyl-tRNA(Gln) amidotransferase subunit C
MALSRADVLHIADLAGLRLTGSEAASYLRAFNDILRYMEILEQLETAHVPPFRRHEKEKNVLRPDEPRESIQRGKALRAAPSCSGAYISVPNVMPLKKG